MDLGPFFTSGVKFGYLVSRMKQLELEGQDLRARVSQFPPEQQFTFALMQTGSLARLWRTVSLEDAIRLAASVLAVPEDGLRAELDAAVETFLDRSEGSDTL